VNADVDKISSGSMYKTATCSPKAVITFDLKKILHSVQNDSDYEIGCHPEEAEALSEAKGQRRI
jgi:hypothetical protein